MIFDFDAQVAVGEEIFHHFRIADVVGEFFVRRAHAKGFGKFGGLELDVLVAENLGDFGEKIFAPDGQIGKNAGSVRMKKENQWCSVCVPFLSWVWVS